MRLHQRLALSLAAVALLPVAQVLAADYDPPIYTEPAAEYVPVEVGNGWYLRGDVGYALTTDTDPVSYRTFNTVNGTYGSAVFDSSEIDKTFNAGVGFGYRFSEWVRADATLDGFEADFSGTTSSVTPCPLGAANTGCRSEDSAELSAVSVMANGYVDLGTYMGVTPYVGAGAGFAHVSWSDLTSRNYCTGAGCIGAIYPAYTSPGEKDWRFTYAFMAGAAYDLTKNLKVDLGYKYRRIEDGDMFGWNSDAVIAGATGIQGTDGGLNQHEVRVGLRYELW